MDDAGLLVLAVVAGGLLSVPMVSGLWWTLRRLPDARWPVALALLSFWGRLGVTVLGFYLVTAGDWRRGVAALVGFLIGRTLLVRWHGRPAARVAEGA